MYKIMHLIIILNLLARLSINQNFGVFLLSRNHSLFNSTILDSQIDEDLTNNKIVLYNIRSNNDSR